MGYSTRDAADLLGLPVSRIRAWARDGLLEPERSDDGWAFSFRDVVLLRTARALLDADVPVRRVRRALLDLRRTLPDGRPLSAVHLSARGAAVVVTDEGGTWEPTSRQLHLDLLSPGDTEPPGPASAAVTLDAAPLDATASASVADAAEWYRTGRALEADRSREAAAAYRRTLELDPQHANAHLDLGRLLHEEGDVAAAEAHYRAAVAADPGSARASYNLGVALEDRGRPTDAVAAYEAALARDPGLAVAHFNLSRLLEGMGRAADALGHLSEYKRLVEGRG